MDEGSAERRLQQRLGLLRRRSRGNSPARRCGGPSGARPLAFARRASSAATTRRLSSRRARASSSSGRTPAATKPPSRASGGRSSPRPRSSSARSSASRGEGDKACDAQSRSRRARGRAAPPGTFAIRARGLAVADPARRAPRSRGPPRPSARRDSARAMSPAPFRRSRVRWRRRAGPRRSQSTASSRAFDRCRDRAAGGPDAPPAGARRRRSPCDRRRPSSDPSRAPDLRTLDLEARARGRIDGHDVGLAAAPRRASAPAPCRPGWSPDGRRSGRARRPPRRRRVAEAVQRARRRRAASAAPPPPRVRPAPAAIGCNAPPAAFSACDQRSRRRTGGREPGSPTARSARQRRGQALAVEQQSIPPRRWRARRWPAAAWPCAHRHRGQAVRAARVEQAVLGQGAGRHHPHHVAVHHRLGAALARLGGVFHLLADGDLEARRGSAWRDRPRRHAPARRPWGSAPPACLPRLVRVMPSAWRRLHRVLEEQLVEVAHAEEHQGVRLARLGLEELRHHRRGVGGQVRG